MENQQELQLQELKWRKLENNPSTTNDTRCLWSMIQHKYKTELKITKLWKESETNCMLVSFSTDWKEASFCLKCGLYI